MIVLVTGGRDFTDVEHLFYVLDTIHKRKEISVIVHGGAKGADNLAGQWAKSRGIKEDVYPADWSKGKSAGYDRNNEMLKMANPDLIVAFAGGKGTAHMVKQAKGRFKKVLEV